MRAEHAQAQHADREGVARMRIEHFPAALRLQRFVFVEAAQVAQHGVRHIFGHLRRHAGVFETHELCGARQRAGMFAFERENRIDARAEIEDGAQSVALREHLTRRPPDDGEIGRGGVARLPLAQFGFGQRAGEIVQPGGGFVLRRVEEDFHAIGAGVTWRTAG